MMNRLMKIICVLAGILLAAAAQADSGLVSRVISMTMRC